MNMNRPVCFGDLEQVFPLTPDGLRHCPEGCVACVFKTLCLKTAIAGDKKVVMASERLDRAYHAGAVSFLQRWSERKRLHNLRDDNRRADDRATDSMPAGIPDAPIRNDAPVNDNDNYS